MKFAPLLALCATAATAQDRPSARPPFRVSLSVSPFTEIVLKSGLAYADGKNSARTPEELQRLLVRRGANEVYARIATSRKYRTGFGDHSVERGLERARLAKSLNLPFNPELGLFDIYGDIRCQPSPDFSEYPELKTAASWTSLPLDRMVEAMRAYGAIAAREILSTGVRVRVWDLGNEVEFGVAGVAVQPLPGGCDDTEGGPKWYRPPDAVDPEIRKMSVIGLMQMPEAKRIAWLETHLWPHMARLFAAVAAGIRSVDPSARFSTHVSGITAVLPAQAVAFFRALRAGGYDPDELGFSFYPTSTDKPAGRLEAFKDTVTRAHEALGRPVFIAELGYPAAPMTEGAFASWNHALPGFPISPQGQAALLRHLAKWGRSAGVSGIRPWAPETPVPGWEPMALFARDGSKAVARPALGAIAKGAR